MRRTTTGTIPSTHKQAHACPLIGCHAAHAAAQLLANAPWLETFREGQTRVLRSARKERCAWASCDRASGPDEDAVSELSTYVAYRHGAASDTANTGDSVSKSKLLGWLAVAAPSCKSGSPSGVACNRTSARRKGSRRRRSWSTSVRRQRRWRRAWQRRPPPPRSYEQALETR